MLDERIEALSSEIEVVARRDVGRERLMSVPGIGPIISSAMVAAIGGGDAFSKGRTSLLGWVWSPSKSQPATASSCNARLASWLDCPLRANRVMRCGTCDGPPVPVLFIAVNGKFPGGQTRPEIACTKSLYFAQKALPWWSFMCKARSGGHAAGGRDLVGDEAGLGCTDHE